MCFQYEKLLLFIALQKFQTEKIMLQRKIDIEAVIRAKHLQLHQNIKYKKFSKFMYTSW